MDQFFLILDVRPQRPKDKKNKTAGLFGILIASVKKKKSLPYFAQ